MHQPYASLFGLTQRRWALRTIVGPYISSLGPYALSLGLTCGLPVLIGPFPIVVGTYATLLGTWRGSHAGIGKGVVSGGAGWPVFVTHRVGLLFRGSPLAFPTFPPPDPPSLRISLRRV